MGTDIHMMVEVQRDNGEWVAVKAMPNKASHTFRNIEKILNKPESSRTEWEKYLASYYEHILNNGGTYEWVEPPRNYHLFAILGNVRNTSRLLIGDGFDVAKKQSQVFKPISDNRGIPEDASPEYKEFVKEWEDDGHSHSYVTLQDVLDFDFDQKATLVGVVDSENYKKYLEKGKPDKWYGYVAGPGVELVSHIQMNDILSGKVKPDPNTYYYTVVSWDVTYRECCQFFLDNIVPEVMNVTRDMVNSDWSKVRFVFFFDS